MPDILITEDITGEPVDELAKQFDVVRRGDLWRIPEELKSTVRDFRALIIRNQTQVTQAVVEAGARLEVIARAGVGLDNVDVQAASHAGVSVVFAPEQNSISVAELTLGLMLSLARKIPGADRSTKAGGWERKLYTGVELYGKTLGVFGLGRIGYRTAVRAKAFGMDVVAHDDYIHPDSVATSELRARLVTVDELLQSSDFVSCHLPLTDETRGFFDYDRLCQMKPSAFFVNTSRGEVVREADLIRALTEERLAGAALDVREEEPPQANALAGMENVILTPHIAAFAREGQQRVLASVCADVDAVLRGAHPKNVASV